MQKQLKSLPAGKLICASNENRCKWYLSDGKHSTYLPKNKRFLAEQLALKKYLTLQLEDAIHEKRALDFYLRHHSKEAGKAQKLLTDQSHYHELLADYFTPSAQDHLTWMNSPFEHNEKYPEQLIHRTISGHYVRSKSELLIDMSLHIHKIPFRYECALPLGDATVYPDFTILHPENNQIYYWEHFGKMDDPVYCRSACSKLNLYAAGGILPGINLIATYETKEHPLGTETIEMMIQLYLC